MNVPFDKLRERNCYLPSSAEPWRDFFWASLRGIGGAAQPFSVGSLPELVEGAGIPRMEPEGGTPESPWRRGTVAGI